MMRESRVNAQYASRRLAFIFDIAKDAMPNGANFMLGTLLATKQAIFFGVRLPKLETKRKIQFDEQEINIKKEQNK